MKGVKEEFRKRRQGDGENKQERKREQNRYILYIREKSKGKQDT